MLPGNILSTTIIPGGFIPPDNKYVDKIVDWELGGVALSDGSLGLEFQFWQANLYIDQLTGIGTVTVQAPTFPETVLFALSGITEISLTFDQNMHPFVAFMQAGQARYWWFDPTIPGQVFANLPVGVRSPKVSLDDKRPQAIPDSDILMGYMVGDDLFYRLQRDRFTIEYPLATNLVGDLLWLGMTDKMRVQFALGIFP